MSSIGSVAERVAGCTRCGLCRTRTRAVPGRGDPDADVMFVGEAPGRSEDLRGEPFVGAAGRVLEAALGAAGASRESVYITNVVKCRPPGNRVPKDGEREACSGYLEEEVALVRPRVICVLGNTAFGSVLGGSEITKHRGRLARRGGQLYFITVHPAAAIYNRGLVPVLEGDIARLFGIASRLAAGGEVEADVEYPA